LLAMFLNLFLLFFLRLLLLLSHLFPYTTLFRSTSLDQVQSEHLIWCTGFRPALGPVRRLLREGIPEHPGLHLVGYGDWTGPGSADRKSTRLNSSHVSISYAVFCLKKKTRTHAQR